MYAKQHANVIIKNKTDRVKAIRFKAGELNVKNDLMSVTIEADKC